MVAIKGNSIGLWRKGSSSMEDEIIILTNILKKYIGIKLFKAEQYKFKKEFFDSLFDPYENIDYSRRSMDLINDILQEDNLPYVFSSDMEIDDDKDTLYWILKDLNRI